MLGTENARLLALEEKVAYQDKLIAELNDVVVQLNRSVSAVEARLRATEGVVGREFAGREMPNEKPPHY